MHVRPTLPARSDRSLDTSPNLDGATRRGGATVDPPAAAGFSELGLSPPLLRALADEGYETPTPIQARAIPHVLAGHDLLGCAQTGTGKTAAFALPIIERMRAAPEQAVARGCRTLVLAPTRELAAQIHASFRTYGRHVGLTATVIHGGVSQRPQEHAVRRGVEVLVATPGRLLDLVGQRLLDLRAVRWLVLDEADRMLDMGFIHDMRRIVALLPERRQTLLFSATLPREVRDLARTMLRDPLEVQAAPQATPAATVSQSVHFVEKREKKSLLVQLLRDQPMERVIVFTRTKHGADKLQRDLEKAGITAAAIHGNKSQGQRERALAAFKSPRPPVLVATDLAARGLDVDDVSHVINYELPHEPETYVHRIGRTGRAGQTGEAVAFCDAEERPRLDAIEDLLRLSIARCNEPPSPSARRRDAGSAPAARRGGPRGGERSRPQGRGRGRASTGRSGRYRRGRAAGGDAPPPAAAGRWGAAQPPAARPAAGGGRRRHRRAL